jgi:hypothetical protein
MSLCVGHYVFSFRVEFRFANREGNAQILEAIAAPDRLRRLKLVGVLEPRDGPQGFPGRAGQNQLAVNQLELRNGNSNIVFCQGEETTSVYDGVSDSLVIRNDDVIDGSNPFVETIVDRLPENLPFGAPTDGNVTQLRDTDTDKSRSGDLGIRNCRRKQSDACDHQNVDEPHTELLCWKILITLN